MTFALHGNLGVGADWRSREFFAGELATPDLWDEIDEGLAPSEWAERFCRQVRESAGAEKCLLAGYSLGGRLALHALMDAPECWLGAVIVSSHPGLSEEAGKSARLEKDRQWAERARHENWDDFLAAWNEQPVFGGGPTESVLQRQRQLQPRREEIARAFEIWSLGRQENLAPQLATCTVPVLWVTGARDEKFSQIAASVVDVMPHADHLAIPNCGHRVLAEAPGELTAAIGDFQNRIL